MTDENESVPFTPPIILPATESFAKDQWIQKSKALLFDCQFCVDSPQIREEIDKLIEEGGGYNPGIDGPNTPLRWKRRK